MLIHVQKNDLGNQYTNFTRPSNRGEFFYIHSSFTSTAQDNYLDAYLRVIRETDPTETALVFSCGMGAVRTTFAMVAASLVRRKQIIAKGGSDPYALKTPSGIISLSSGTPGMNTVCDCSVVYTICS